MKKALYIFAALAAFTMVSCSSTKGSKTPAPIEKDALPSELCGEWKIISLTDIPKEKMIEATLFVSPEDAVPGFYTVQGFSGVNQFFATIGDSLKSFPIGETMASTKMMGTPEEMEFEDSLVHTLATAAAWKIAGNTLTVSNGEKTAVYRKIIQYADK